MISLKFTWIGIKVDHMGINSNVGAAEVSLLGLFVLLQVYILHN